MPNLERLNGKFAARPLADRFWEKVEIAGGCWIWTGRRSIDGYGRIKVSSKKELPAHHVSYFLKFDEWLPFDLDPDHTCKNPSCVRWGYGHLEAISKDEHKKRTALTHPNRVKTHCIRNHSRWGFRANGSRYCMDCNNLRAKGML